MFLFFLCAALTFIVISLLLLPFFRASEELAEQADYNISIYQDQLVELAKDVKRGTVLPAEEQAARLEIERRVLDEDKSRIAAARSGTKGVPIIVLGLIGLLPVLAGGLYIGYGKPALPAVPFNTRTDSASAPTGSDGMHADMNSLLINLEKKLEDDPDNLENWAKYARSLSNLGRYDEAVNAYIETLRLGGGTDRQLAAEYAETLVIANDGLVSQASRSVFEKFIEEDPNDPQAIYYLALAKAQEGQTQEALADWQKLLDNSPPGAPWVETVTLMIEQVEATGAAGALMAPGATSPEGQGPEGQGPEGQGSVRNPTSEQARAIQSMSGDDQQAFMDQQIKNLAERLKTTDRDNLNGWRMLARSYTVQGRAEEARTAYEEVLRLAPNDPAALEALGR